MVHDPLGNQRFVEGTHKYENILDEAQRAHENTEHARNVERQSFNWKAAILLLILIAGAVGGVIFLYRITP